MLAVRVRKAEAEAVRRNLLRRGALDKKRKIISRKGWVEIPVSRKEGGYEHEEQVKPAYYRPRLSFEAVRESLRDELGKEVAKLKGGWELIGDVLVLKLPFDLGLEKKIIIARRFKEFMPRARVVLNRMGIENPYREPCVEVLVPGGTETVHKENGCRFKVDPRRVMFSAGNQEERRRMADIAAKDEVVLDMFAGVGQFTVPLAKYSKPRKVIAIEKNPRAYQYLQENIKLNGLLNVTPVLGDCREKSPKGGVNRVLMGYFFNVQEFLPHALAAFDGTGVIHLHDLVLRRGLQERALELEKKVTEQGYELVSMKPRRVKSYSPSRHHAVFDMVVEWI